MFLQSVVWLATLPASWILISGSAPNSFVSFWNQEQAGKWTQNRECPQPLCPWAPEPHFGLGCLSAASWVSRATAVSLLLSAFRKEILEFLHKHHIGREGGRGFYFHFKALKDGESEQGGLLYLRGSRWVPIEFTKWNEFQNFHFLILFQQKMSLPL